MPVKSIVSFDLVDPIPVEQGRDYPSLGVAPRIDNGRWIGLEVTIEHDEETGPAELIDSARGVVRTILTVVGAARKVKPVLGRVDELRKEDIYRDEMNKCYKHLG